MKAAITSQYHAALAMLLTTIEKCPDELWDDDNYDSPYWRIVYHALFYTDLYLSENVELFVAWEKHLPAYNRLGKLMDDQSLLITDTIYSKEELTAYAGLMEEKALSAVNESTFESESGFDWIEMTRFELHLYNIRHVQHHVGQLIERLHQNGITGIDWKGKG